MRNYNLRKRHQSRSATTLIPQTQFQPWDKDDIISGNIHHIVHIPHLMISKTFNADVNVLDPLKVYHILQNHDLISTKSARYKDIVDKNIQSIFVAAGNLQ